MVRPLIVPNPKLTMEINGGSNGWTESHFYTSAVPLTDATLMLAAYNLVAKRCSCLDGVNAKMFAARLSLDDVSRDSKQVDISGIIPDPATGYFSLGGPNPSVTGIWSYQTVQVSWPVVLSTSQSTTNPIEYLAGMPANDSQFGPFPYDATASQPTLYLSNYLNQLTIGAWGALGRGWGNGFYQLTNIAMVAGVNGGPNQLAFTTTSPFPSSATFPVGHYIRLADATYTSPQRRLRLNGTYTIQKYDPATGIVTVNVPRILVAPTWGAFGSIEVADASVYTYTGWAYRPITHRKRGRPFGGGRGRR